jgi:FMN phosphatase YigB (HAD superfamily)
MSIKVVLFDLDGTLLPMDMEQFTKAYFGLLAKKLAPLGYEPEKLIQSIWTGTAAMVKNDGTKPNEKAFWDKFCEIYGEKAIKDLPYFDAYYREDFDKVQASCGFSPLAKKVVDSLKERGYRVALATNPIFPSIATEKRIAWAGLSPSDFEMFTTYENSRFCKPNLNYYKDILAKLEVSAEECLMIGNDVSEDMVAAELGMNVFLLTDCILNKKNDDITKYFRGGFPELLQYIENEL